MSRLTKDVPSDWKIIQFDKVFDFLSTLTLSREDLTSDIEYNGIYNLHYGDIHSTYKYVELNFNVEKSIPKITKENIDESKLTFLKTGDIVVADASEDYEGVAACIELSNVESRKVTAGLHTFAARDKNGYSAEGFRAYLLKHPWVSNELKKLATGSKVYGVSKSNISKLEIVLPPLPEQQKIAGILSKWDELIEDQTKLIKAKEKQKTSLMQKLLSGEVRFPGFEEEWEELELNDIFDKIIGGGTPSRQNPLFWNGDIFWCTVKDFTNFNLNQTQETITDVGLKSSASNLVPKGTLIIPTRMAIGKIALFDVDVAINQDLKALFLNKKAKNKFLYQWFNFYSASISNLGTGSTVKGIKLEELKSIKILLPSVLEQEKIADFLSSLDIESQSSNDELEAMKLQKKGLMQQLLTGKIRVKV